MADHPFHGDWKSYVIRENHIVAGPFDLHLNITPAGGFVDGTHDGTKLKCNHISTRQIYLKELGGENGTLKAEIVVDLTAIRRKALTGTAEYPQAFAPRGEKTEQAEPLKAQNDGVWVGTQP